MSAEIKWIKITTTMFEDEKIDFIESLPEMDSILIIWIKLLTLAGKSNMGGYIFLTENIPYTDEMLAHKFKRPLNTVRLALETFNRLGMIESTQEGIYITNWEKHQNIEGMERVRKLNRERVSKHRQLKSQCNVTVTPDVTPSNATDIDKELDIDKEKEKKKRVPKDTPTKIHYAENVRMTETEYDNLVQRLGETLALDYIDRLNLYKGSTGKRYTSDYMTILNWHRKDDKREVQDGRHQQTTGKGAATSGRSAEESITKGKLGWINRDKVQLPDVSGSGSDYI